MVQRFFGRERKFWYLGLGGELLLPRTPRRRQLALRAAKHAAQRRGRLLRIRVALMRVLGGALLHRRCAHSGSSLLFGGLLHQSLRVQWFLYGLLRGLASGRILLLQALGIDECLRLLRKIIPGRDGLLDDEVVHLRLVRLNLLIKQINFARIINRFLRRQAFFVARLLLPNFIDRLLSLFRGGIIFQIAASGVRVLVGLGLLRADLIVIIELLPQRQVRHTARRDLRTLRLRSRNGPRLRRFGLLSVFCSGLI